MSGRIGNLYYDDARGVQIAGKYLDGGDPADKTPHSAVHSAINVLTNSVTEAQAIIAQWPRIMDAAQGEVLAIISELPTEG